MALVAEGDGEDARKAVPNEVADEVGAVGDPLEECEEEEWHHGPYQRHATRPGRNQQEPCIDGCVPQCDDDETVDEETQEREYWDADPRRDQRDVMGKRATVAMMNKTMSVATATAKVMIGRTTSGIAILHSTVVESETGRDFQNRMLRSWRSLRSASSE